MEVCPDVDSNTILCSSCNGSSDRSFMNNFFSQPVLHDWCNRGRGMCYRVCGMIHIKEPLLLIGKSSPCYFTVYLTSYNRK